MKAWTVTITVNGRQFRYAIEGERDAIVDGAIRALSRIRREIRSATVSIIGRE